MIYETPDCGPEEEAALEPINQIRKQLRCSASGGRRRWIGSVRRVLAAKAIQGSNSIEGYNVSDEDAVAAVEGVVEPTDSKWEDYQAVQGYRRAMTYVLQLAQDEHFEYSAALFRGLHFMMTEYTLNAGPGLWRPGAIWVRNDATGKTVYEAPSAEYVPGLVDELVNHLSNDQNTPAMVRAAMAHLNLVLIHPFRDGNGRMARGLQTLVLARERIMEPEFCSIEEYLGEARNTQNYYNMLAEVGRGEWAPENDARPWVRYCLQAHYIQANSVLRRVKESEQMWAEVETLMERHHLPDRSLAALFDAVIGLRVRNGIYRATLIDWDEEISNQTATSDLRAMVNAGLLEQHGIKRGTSYTAAEPLQEIRLRVRKSREEIDAGALFSPLSS